MGVWQDEEKGIGRIFQEYYESLFTTSHLEVSEELLQAIHGKVMWSMNSLLS